MWQNWSKANYYLSRSKIKNLFGMINYQAKFVKLSGSLHNKGLQNWIFIHIFIEQDEDLAWISSDYFESLLLPQ